MQLLFSIVISIVVFCIVLDDDEDEEDKPPPGLSRQPQDLYFFYSFIHPQLSFLELTFNMAK